MALTQLVQEPIWDGAEHRLARRRLAEIKSRPVEFILLVTHHPRPLPVESEMVLDLQRNFNRGSILIGLNMSNRKNRKKHSRIFHRCRDDDARPQFPA